MSELNAIEAIDFIEKELDREWMKIFLQNRTWISELFTALLYELNYFLGSKLVLETDGEYFEANMLIMPEFRNKLVLLDQFLNRGLNQISPLNYSARVQKMYNLEEFDKVVFLCKALDAFKSNPNLKLVVNADGTWEDSWTKEFKEAVQNWFNTADIDKEWRRFYFDKSVNLRRRITPMLQKDFAKLYEVDYSSFFSLNQVLETKVEDHIQKHLQMEKSQPEKMPLLAFDEIQLAKNAGLDSKSNEWTKIKSLTTYRPGLDINFSPFIPVLMMDGTEKLLPLLPVFFPLRSMFSSWVYRLVDLDDGKALGTIGEDYGIQFENYVRKKIKIIKSSLELYPTNLEVKPINAELEKGLRSVGKPNGLEIDVIAWDDQTVYVISCKSRDFHFGTQLLRGMIFVRYRDVKVRLRTNAKDLAEIKQATDFLAKSSKLVGLPSFKNKKMVSIVVYPYSEPICESSLRKWYENQEKLPNVETFTIGNFVEFLKSI